MTHVTKNTFRTTRTAGLLCGLLAVLITAGCEEADEDLGAPFVVTLPTDTLLNLQCEDAGVWNEGNEACILNDPENPFKDVGIAQFSVFLEEDGLDQPPSYYLNLYGELPADVSGAKARFYLMATALAKFPNSETQYYTALALHELYNDNGDDLIKQQALKAYRSVLDNFYGGVTFFNIPLGSDVFIPFETNLLTVDNLYRPAATNYTWLFTTQLGAQQEIGSWGYRFTPCDDLLAADANACPIRGDVTIISP